MAGVKKHDQQGVRLFRSGPILGFLFSVLALSGPVRADDDPSQASSDPHVTARKGEVTKQDFNMDVRSGWDLKVPKQVTLGPDGQQIIVTSMKLQPPLNWNFEIIPIKVAPSSNDNINMEPQSEGTPIFPPWNFVDVQWGLYGITQVGVLKDTATEVQGFCILPAEPTNAANFPLEMEGNLQPPSAPGGPGEPVKFRWMAKTAKICIDLDVDSDNNNALNAPDHSDVEDRYEDTSEDNTRPGKIVVVNDQDLDNDLIPDYADGYNLDGTAGNDDDGLTVNTFAQMVLCIPASIDTTKAKVRITYSASDPSGVTRSGTSGNYTYALPATATLRIWTKDATVARKPASILASGNFIPSGTFDATTLGFNGTIRTKTFYVEAVKAGASQADQRILVEVDPDGTGSVPFQLSDAVRISAATVVFSPASGTKTKYGYDAFAAIDTQDNYGGPITTKKFGPMQDYVSVMKSDSTIVSAEIRGVRPEFVTFTSSANTSITLSPSTASSSPCEVTITGQNQNKAFADVDANDPSGVRFRRLGAWVYKGVTGNYTLFNVQHGTAGKTDIAFPTLSPADSAAYTNDRLKKAVISVDIRGSGAATASSYDKNGNGILDVAGPGYPMSNEQTQIEADCAPVTDRIRIIYVHDVRANYYLTANAPAGTNTIKLANTNFIQTGGAYTIEEGATTEWITVTAINTGTNELTVTGRGAGGKLAHSFTTAGNAALILPVGGRSSDGTSPIFVEDAGSETAVRAIMTHEIGHTTGHFSDLTTQNHIMFFGTWVLGDELRYRELPKKWVGGNEKQWDVVPR